MIDQFLLTINAWMVRDFAWAVTGSFLWGIVSVLRWVVNFVRHAMRPSELINPVAFVQMLPGRCTPVQLAAAACCKKFLYIQ